MATLQSELNSDVTDIIGFFEESFVWNKSGVTYPCVIGDRHHSLIVRKALFTGGRYPQWGELITVAGKIRQITRLNGSELVTSSGGMVESPPFVDRPDATTLEIEFDVLIKRT